MSGMLKVTAWLGSPIAGDIPHLDALLEFEMSQRLGLANKLRRDLPAPEEGVLHIPMCRNSIGGRSVACCSSPIALPRHVSREFFAKRLSVENADMLAQNQRLVVATGLSGTDRLVGGFFGAARGLAMVVAFLLVAGFTPLPADPWWKESSVIQRLMPMVVWAQSFLPQGVQDELDFNPELPDPKGKHPGGSADEPASEGEPAHGEQDTDRAAT